MVVKEPLVAMPLKFRCSTAHFRMAVKALESEEWIDECCSTAHFCMVVKNVRSIDVC